MGLRASRMRPRKPDHRGRGFHNDADFADTAEPLPQVNQWNKYPGEQTALLGSMETGNGWRLTAVGEILKRLGFNRDLLI